MKLNRLFLGAALAAIGVLGAGCNLTGGIDSSKSRDERILDAQAKMDTGDCGGAISILNSLGDQDDRSLQMLGTAYLCNAGATVKKVDAALGSYDSSSNNLTVIGTLANRLVPTTNDADSGIVSAINAFNRMSASNNKSVWQIYGNIVRIANLMAKASADSATVHRSDIGLTACLAASCGTAPAACSGARMGDGDATNALTALQAAAAAAGNTSLGSIATLANNLNTLLGGSASQNATRCVLFNNALSN
ncbi:MAG: hypothetical protein HY075_07980 [Deltaproteobacteria bacterium]|nr:hypothetical protein [Deltaproteobacteria bacterium]